MPEIIDAGNSGFLVSPQRYGRLCPAYLELAKDPSLRQTMGAAGRKRVEDLFQFEDKVSELESLLEGWRGD